MTLKTMQAIGIISLLLAVLVGKVMGAQEEYSLKSPSGVASDFRGYEEWSVVSSARTDEVLKVIVANPAMIKAPKERYDVKSLNSRQEI